MEAPNVMLAQINSIVTPIDYIKLDSYLEGYNIEEREYLVNGFKNGFKLEFSGSGTSSIPSNLKSTLMHPEITKEKIDNELKAGRFIGPFLDPPFDNQIVSPIGLQPKKTNNKFRLITHLSHPKGSSVNDGISKEFSSVKYASVVDAISILKKLGKKSYMAKTDIENAFRIIPLHPSQFRFLVFKFQDNWYVDKCLPMGARSSCAIFEKFSSALEWVMKNKLNIKHVVHILDDFLLINKYKKSCAKQLKVFLEFCLEVGIPIAFNKTFPPSTIMEFAGIELNSIEMLSKLPVDKKLKCIAKLEEISNKNSTSLKELQQLTGLLSYATLVVYVGRVFIRRLFNLMIGKTKKYAKIKISEQVKEDLLMWLDFMNNFNGKNMFMDDRWFSNKQLDLYCDSSKTIGFGAYMGKAWFYGTWDMDVSKLDITTLELYPILVAINLWKDKLANLNLLIHTDNEALVAILNSQTVKNNEYCLSLLRKLVLICLKHNILIRATHIRGCFNTLSDLLSRSQVAKFKSLAPEMLPEPIPLPPSLSLSKLLKM